jgi:hypothetical protein
MENQPFPFLALPAELRLLVYEQIDIVTTTHVIDAHKLEPERQLDKPEGCSTILMARKTVDTSILATCRLVHCEAFSHLTGQAQKSF